MAAAIPAHAQACSQALMLGLDVSGSVDAREYRIQMDGLGRALLSEDVQGLILSHAVMAPVSILIFEWSDQSGQGLIADWTSLDSAESLQLVASRVLTHHRGVAPEATSIGSALTYAAVQFERAPDCEQRTLDISGDGKNNAAPRPEVAREIPGLADVRINGLVIGASAENHSYERMVEISDLVSYYTTNVIRGEDAFVETALGYDAFETAMIRKLVRELPALAVGALME
ncbi:MAG: DUF1194 domain-containing protein [Pseudomonadota bacterium]